MSQASPVTASSEAERPDYASVWERGLAFALDALVLGIVTVPLNPVLYGPGLAPSVASGLFSAGTLVAFAWVTFFEGRYGSAPGKRVLRLKVVDPSDGTEIGYRRALVRRLGWLASIAPLYLGLAWMLWDPQRQTFHDKLARSIVIRRR
jgi:uncharacterized RDD family membrane protein YckC